MTEWRSDLGDLVPTNPAEWGGPTPSQETTMSMTAISQSWSVRSSM